MTIKIHLSQFGPEMQEGKILRWLKREGETVTQGEALIVIESDKAVVEIESPVDGILGSILKGEESLAAVGEVLGEILTPDESVQPTALTPSSPAEPPSASPDRQPRSDGTPRISPLAKRLAQDQGIDITRVPGSGPKGRITEADIQRAAQAPLAPTRPPSPVQQPVAGRAEQTAPSPAHGARIPLAGIRATSASRLQESHQVTAPVTLTTEVCATPLVELRQQLLSELTAELDFSIGYNELLIKVAARALRKFPYINARLEDGAIRLLDEIHIGLAVDTPRGLVVPVIRDADQKDIAGVCRELHALVEKVHAGSAAPADLSGGTFTITNLGKYEIDAFTPIINLPQAAILGVGEIKQRPYVVDGQLVVREVVWLSLTFDHRLVDGAPAALFLQYIKRLIEKPVLFLM